MRQFALVLLLLSAVACHRPVEDTARHVVHHGDAGVLVTPSGTEVYLATNKADCYAVQSAVSAQDTRKFNELVAQGKVFAVPAGTAVKVLSEASNERQVEISEGPLAGKTGWAEWEFIKSALPKER